MVEYSRLFLRLLQALYRREIFGDHRKPPPQCHCRMLNHQVRFRQVLESRPEIRPLFVVLMY